MTTKQTVDETVIVLYDHIDYIQKAMKLKSFQEIGDCIDGMPLILKNEVLSTFTTFLETSERYDNSSYYLKPRVFTLVAKSLKEVKTFVREIVKKFPLKNYNVQLDSKSVVCYRSKYIKDIALFFEPYSAYAKVTLRRDSDIVKSEQALTVYSIYNKIPDKKIAMAHMALFTELEKIKKSLEFYNKSIYSKNIVCI